MILEHLDLEVDSGYTKQLTPNLLDRMCLSNVSISGSVQSHVFHCEAKKKKGLLFLLGV